MRGFCKDARHNPGLTCPIGGGEHRNASRFLEDQKCLLPLMTSLASIDGGVVADEVLLYVLLA